MHRVTLVSRVTARSLQSNIVGYVPPSGDSHAISVLNHCLSCYKFVDTQLYATPDSGLTYTYTAVNATPCSSYVMYHIS